MDAVSIDDLPAKKRSSPSIGGDISLIVMWSVMAGLRLDHALSSYLHPIRPYDWVGDVILGVAFLLASIAISVRLWRRTKPATLSD